MMDEITFRNEADKAIEALKKSLMLAEEQVEEGAEFETEEQNGVLNVLFEEPAGKFVITPNAPVRQIWISALSTSFKLDWSEAQGKFVLPKTGEALKPLIERLINDHLAQGEDGPQVVLE